MSCICTYLKKRESLTSMSVIVITGPMFSGKTTELIRRAREYKERHGLRVLVINHAKDVRTTQNTVRTHDGVTYPAVHAHDLMLVNTRQYDVIAVDEGQFFNNLRTFVDIETRRWGKRVLVAGLNSDYLRRPFGEMPLLMSLADHVVVKHSTCSACSSLALFTQRLSDNGDTIDVGGAEKYAARCRNCWRER